MKFETIESLEGFSMESGTIINKYLNKELKLLNKFKYENVKLKFWKHLISLGIMPTKWYEPDFEGTKIDFEVIDDSLKVVKATDDLISALSKYKDEMEKMIKCGE